MLCSCSEQKILHTIVLCTIPQLYKFKNVHRVQYNQLLGCHNSRGVHQTWLDPEFYPQSVSVSVTTEQVSVNMWCVVSRPGAKSWVVFLSYHSLLQPVSIFFSYLGLFLCFDPTHSSTFVLAEHFATLFLAWKYNFSKLWLYPIFCTRPSFPLSFWFEFPVKELVVFDWITFSDFGLWIWQVVLWF